VASVRRDLQSANEELLSARGELTLAQNRLAEQNAEIAARGIVFSALAEAEQRHEDLKASVAAKSVETTALTKNLASLRVELVAVVADLERSRNQLADTLSQRTNAEIKRDEAIRTTQTAEESTVELRQSIEVRTEALVRLQADLSKARMDLAKENEAVERTRAALAALTSEPVANQAQTDGPETAGDGIAPEQIQTDASTVDPALGRAVVPNPMVPADGDGVQEQPVVSDQGEGN